MVTEVENTPVVPPEIAPALVIPPVLLLIPPVIDAPPDATVSPVKPPSVPVMVELPVIAVSYTHLTLPTILRV